MGPRERKTESSNPNQRWGEQPAGIRLSYSNYHADVMRFVNGKNVVDCSVLVIVMASSIGHYYYDFFAAQLLLVLLFAWMGFRLNILLRLKLLGTTQLGFILQ